MIGCYGYDSFGNRTLAGYTATDCGGTYTGTATFTPNNQVNTRTNSNGIVSAFQYDSAGNLYYDGTNLYAYDAEGRLCAVQVGTVGTQYQYIYDASGTRVAKGTFTGTFPAKNTPCATPGAAPGFTLTNEYLLDLGGDQVTELNTSTGSMAWAHSNVWAGSHLDATYDPKGLHFHLADPLGTRRVQANPTGQVEETCQSLPFGDLPPNDLQNCFPTTLSTADDATEHHFTGKERDSESGLDYFGARYYASNMGRFSSPDPSSLFFADPGNPQSFNLYGYVRNNPVNSIDTDGLLTIIVPGTWWSPNDWNYQNPLLAEAVAHFHETHKIWLDQWDPRGDHDSDRATAAAGLRAFINSYKFAPGETLNIITHSHGGNVALMAAALGLNHKIDTLITLGAPFGYAKMSAGVGQWYNVTGSGDDVQPSASKGCWTTTGCANQQGAHNTTVNASSHSSLWNDQGVRNEWWGWYDSLQPGRVSNVPISEPIYGGGGSNGGGGGYQPCRQDGHPWDPC